jgi:hypothetical protein
LLAVAVLVGILLLNKVDDSKSPLAGAAQATTTTTAKPPGSTTTTLAPHRPQDVKVLTLNGTTTQGAGRRVSDNVKTQQYNMLAPVDATAAAKAATRFTAVYYTPGYDVDARAIAHFLALPATAVAPYPTTAAPVADTRTANVVIVVGPDLAGAGATTGSSTTAVTHSSTTSTTRKP